MMCRNFSLKSLLLTCFLTALLNPIVWNYQETSTLKRYQRNLRVVVSAKGANADQPISEGGSREQGEFSDGLKEDAVRDSTSQALDGVHPHITTVAAGVPNPGRSENATMDWLVESDLDDIAVRSRRVIYFVSPTYKRTSQMVDLNRLQQTLKLASIMNHERIYWIIVEDSPWCTKRVRDLLESSGLDYAHDAVLTPKGVPVLTSKGAKGAGHRGVAQRNLALRIISSIGAEGVVYFGDDDNAYNTQLFSELPYTRKVGILPVGFAALHTYERCEVSPATGRVIRFISGWEDNRKYPIDMGGFAFSTALLHMYKPTFRNSSYAGHLETNFIELLVSGYDELTPLAANCTKVLVWHVKTYIKEAKDITNDAAGFPILSRQT